MTRNHTFDCLWQGSDTAPPPLHSASGRPALPSLCPGAERAPQTCAPHRLHREVQRYSKRARTEPGPERKGPQMGGVSTPCGEGGRSMEKRTDSDDF
ncbi:hypothetical protein AAFF_G00140940 [Aldrovandia affinis]|uniref:Uncharacterized protein n=1 Tax=Aldrovandia affinis TaxID=143900 RepID=A0AAD7TCE3_9TELE|nr:hypothetical protein AAFF_G00140940 [Aldrovandia affinis]